jgi:hypothetical protein
LRRVEKFKKGRTKDNLSRDNAFRLLMDLLQLKPSEEEE